METVLVTGASGFIGKYVVDELLQDKYQVIVLVRNPDNYQKIGKEIVVGGNLGKPDEMCLAIKDYEIHSCVHLAWEGIPDYSYEYSKKNLQYGMNILELCKECHISNLVITGSCWEYESPVGKIKETDLLSCGNHFKAAKNSLRMISEAFCKENDIHLNWLRLFYVYGEGQRSGSLIPYIIDSFKKGNPPQLNGAYNRNDFIYVRDVAKAIKVCIALKPEVTVMNIGSGVATEILEVVKITSQKVDIKFDETLYQKPDAINDFYADIDLAKQYLNWAPEVSLSEGIERMVQFKSSN